MRRRTVKVSPGVAHAQPEALVEQAVSMVRRADALVDDDAVRALDAPGFFVRRLLEDAEVAQARAALDALVDGGALREAGISRGASARVDRAERSDLMTWLEPNAAPPGLAPLLAGFEALREALNRNAWLGLGRHEVQAACYPADGARYARHRDAFPGPDNRRVTAIVYLNPDWQPAHGGQLRLFVPEADGTERVVEVEPRAGQCVVFLADRVEHEVLPSFARRCAVTAWYYLRSSVTGGLRV